MTFSIFLVRVTYRGRQRVLTIKMTAHDQMRAMLDQLMGTGRNG